MFYLYKKSIDFMGDFRSWTQYICKFRPWFCPALMGRFFFCRLQHNTIPIWNWSKLDCSWTLSSPRSKIPRDKPTLSFFSRLGFAMLTATLLLIQMHHVSQVRLDVVMLCVGYDLCFLPKPLSSHHQKYCAFSSGDPELSLKGNIPSSSFLWNFGKNFQRYYA